ncbi:MAG: hypothetical protein J7M16_00350 [Anaerolineae bacterium]|nr:hypothetical protein [Anaerolineae bacterium]
METIEVQVGTYVVGNGGIVQDSRRPVVFEGEEVAKHTEYFYDNGQRLSDTRGVTQTLYRVSDGRLVVHVEEWSRWQGEPNYYTLVGVTEEDLGVGGHFEALGREAGYGRPLTLDEALTPREQE